MPTARPRLWAITVKAAALAENWLEGTWANPASFSSAMACSTTACRRWSTSTSAAAKHLHDRRGQVQGQRGAQVGRTGAYCPEPGQQLPADHIVLPHVAQNAELDRYPFWRPSGPCPAGDWKWASPASSAPLTSSESLAWLLATRRGRDRCVRRSNRGAGFVVGAVRCPRFAGSDRGVPIPLGHGMGERGRVDAGGDAAGDVHGDGRVPGRGVDAVDMGSGDHGRHRAGSQIGRVVRRGGYSADGGDRPRSVADRGLRQGRSGG